MSKILNGLQLFAHTKIGLKRSVDKEFFPVLQNLAIHCIAGPFFFFRGPYKTKLLQDSKCSIYLDSTLGIQNKAAEISPTYWISANQELPKSELILKAVTLLFHSAENENSHSQLLSSQYKTEKSATIMEYYTRLHLKVIFSRKGRERSQNPASKWVKP